MTSNIQSWTGEHFDFFNFLQLPQEMQLEVFHAYLADSQPSIIVTFPRHRRENVPDQDPWFEGESNEDSDETMRDTASEGSRDVPLKLQDEISIEFALPLPIDDPEEGHAHAPGIPLDATEKCWRLHRIGLNKRNAREHKENIRNVLLANSQFRALAGDCFWGMVRVEVVLFQNKLRSYNKYPDYVVRQVDIATALKRRFFNGSVGSRTKRLMLLSEPDAKSLHSDADAGAPVWKADAKDDPSDAWIGEYALACTRIKFLLTDPYISQLQHVEILIQDERTFNRMIKSGLFDNVLQNLKNCPALKSVSIMGGPCGDLVRFWRKELPQKAQVAGVEWEVNPCLPTCNLDVWMGVAFNGVPQVVQE